MEISNNGLFKEQLELIFSWLPFNDLLNCRTICKDWSELVKTLPEFKSKNCLNLEYCTLSENEEPLTVLKGSNLEFSTIKTHKNFTLVPSAAVTNFFAQLGETVTYLDISYGSDELSSYYRRDRRILAWCTEHLYLFKVLHHFNVGALYDWLDQASKYALEEFDGIECLVEGLMDKHDSKPITYQSLKEFVNKFTHGNCPEEQVWARNKKLIIDKIFARLFELNRVQRNFEKRFLISMKVAEEVSAAVRQNENKLSSAWRSNGSVRILSVNSYEPGIDLVRIQELLPNLEEIHVRNYIYNDDFVDVLNKYPNKIYSYTLYEEWIEEITDCKVPNLEHLNFISLKNWFTEEKAERFVQTYPKVKSIGARGTAMPQILFDYFTEIKLIIDHREDVQIDLTTLELFENLKLLEVDADQDKKYCFFGHKPLILNSIQKLKFYNFSCLECCHNLFKSLPNLRELKYTGPHNSQFTDDIFIDHPKLEKLNFQGGKDLKIQGYWPEMKDLRVLLMAADKIEVTKEDWECFSKKINKVRYLDIFADQEINFDFLNNLGASLPALRQIAITVRRENKVYPQFIKRNGRKIYIKQHQ